MPTPTGWKPGLILMSQPSGYTSADTNGGVMLIQRAPDDDGWLAVDVDGVIYNVFDSIARLYRPRKTAKGRVRHVLAAMNPTEWFGMRPVKLNLKPVGGR